MSHPRNRPPRRTALAFAGKLPGENGAGSLQCREADGLHSSVDELSDLRQRIDATVVPEPPISLSDGGVIHTGVDHELTSCAI